MNVPNMITLGRLMAVPVTVWLILNDFMFIAFWLFVAAGVSDAVDGFLAKRWNQVTEFGAYLDPVADKALLVSVFITLGVQGYLESWLVILVVFRDVMIVGAVVLFQTMVRTLNMDPLFISKVNTLAQIILAALVLGAMGFEVDTGLLMEMMIGIVAVTTMVSGLSYLVVIMRRLDS
ncbi:MAG: CDP-alcohol phosphatidyltransferase family protein [Rhodospirillaceae bacterium]|nr:CDP-alcohol phosphatidyltransferase family protein [Rhodospirillaceae bacterium]